MGFTQTRTFCDANSLRNNAIVVPIGIATNNAIALVVNVPQTNGKIPYLAGSNSGAHSVPVKNSQIETILKSPMDSVPKITIMAIVTATQENAHKNRSDSINRSFNRRITCFRGGAAIASEREEIAIINKILF